MMKKNTLMLTAVLVAGLSLFTVATVAAGTTNVGYEKIKDIMEEVEHSQSGSGAVEITITDNGTEIFAVDASGQLDESGEEAYGAAVIKSNDTTKELEVYKVDDAVYIIDNTDGGNYKMMHTDDYDDAYEGNYHQDKDRQMTAVEEELLDYMVGDLKDNFEVVTHSDASESISFSMESSEVPTLVNLMLKAGTAVDHRMSDRDGMDFTNYPFMSGIDHKDLPDLVEDIKIEALTMQSELDSDNEMTSFNMTLALSGKDVDGEYHEMVVEVATTRDPNEQEVKHLDVDAYDWEIVEQDEDTHRRGNRH